MVKKLIKIIGYLSIALFFMVQVPPGTYGDSDRILYVQTGCSHCEEVKRAIEKHDLEQHFDIRNISLEDATKQEYLDYIEANEIPADQAGVPLMVYDNGEKWISGDRPILEYIEETFDVKIIGVVDYTLSDYLLLGGGMIVVLGVIGYGIFSAINGKGKK